MAVATAPRTDEQIRLRDYFAYLVERGAIERYGPFWQTPERIERIEHEKGVIETAGYEAPFVMLYDILRFCRDEGIVYGPGRGSVGGCYVAYLLGIHEIDSIEYDLYFERFLNPDRVSFPDIDLDFSQRDRDKVLDYIERTYNTGDQVVLRVAAFVRAGARAVVDLMLAAKAQEDPNAGATATNLKKCLPDNVTGGVKIQRELAWWLDPDRKVHGDPDEFRQIAEQAGWLEHMLALDGMFTHLGKHAAGVVILRREDLPILPKLSVRDSKGTAHEVTAYDMYALDDLKYLKWDILGLRTLDVLADAHRMIGGTGQTRDLIKLWREHRDDPDVYEVFKEADTLGVFQMETPGYQRLLREFQPDCFDHIVQLNALNRPGALDFKDDDGRTPMQLAILRRHGKEPIRVDHPDLGPILNPTYGIFLYQEQQMAAARALAGFTLAQADALRKAIGKKRPEEMAKLVPLWEAGTQHIQKTVRDRVWANIEAAARYSWNKSHAVEYGVITWLCAFFKKRHPEAFYASEINSWSEKKERQANVIAEARQHVEFMPPDINLAEDGFTVSEGKIVFGLNGIKGMGDTNRNAILVERLMGGDYQGYPDFCRRVPSVPTNMKRSLIACGAFDRLGEDRVRLLATVPRGDEFYMTQLTCLCVSRKKTALAHGSPVNCATHGRVHVLGVTPGERKRWPVLEHINEDAKRIRDGKAPKPLPDDLSQWVFPADSDLAKGEMEAMGYYISKLPMKDVHDALKRLPANCIGGEVASTRIHQDRNGNDMCTLQLTTPELTRQRVRIFASNWSVWGDRVEKGVKLIFRGRMDDGTYLADACWDPGDYRHYKKIKLQQGGETMVREFDGRLETIRRYEEAGYRVRCL